MDQFIAGAILLFVEDTATVQWNDPSGGEVAAGLSCSRNLCEDFGSVQDVGDQAHVGRHRLRMPITRFMTPAAAKLLMLLTT